MIGASLAGVLAAAGGVTGIEYVGGKTDATEGTTSSWTTSLTNLTGGVASAPAAGDFVVVFYGVASGGASSVYGLTVAGYTQRARLFANDTREAHLLCATKLLTAADTSITLSQTFNTNNGGAVAAHVFRGVDSLNPLDTAVQTSITLNTSEAAPPAITPVTPGAWVVAGGAGAGSATGIFTSADLAGFRTEQSLDFYKTTIGAGYVAKAAGTVNPAPFSFTGVVSSFDAAAAVTLALRPAPAP